MKTKICWTLLITLAIIITGCEKNKDNNDGSVQIILNAGNAGGPASTQLIAGNRETIGEVNISVSGSNILVNYKVTKDGWALAETNLAIENSPDDFPQTSTGNPIPRDFEYRVVHDPYVKEYTYSIAKGGFTTVYMAAHAYAITQIGENCSTLAQREALIPSQSVNVVNTITGGSGLYKIALSNAGELSGDHSGWCADNNQKQADFKIAGLVSSYSKTAELGAIVPVPANLPHLNYMLNKYHDKYGLPVIQASVWRLMNGAFNNPSGGIDLTSDQKKQYETVISDALAKGSNYTPGPSDYLVILVDSGDKIKYQNVLFMFKKCLAVYTDEITWGYGQAFAGNSWARYFGYRVQ
ncbi:MAG TPA: hypothetical protein DDW27_13890 [Bacteroidales bacterium]|nr:hypothetical protein [Bacteroidales bacterium]